MRVLFVSNLFPPHANGGYEQLCQEVSIELAHRGHDVDVLTSALQALPSEEEGQIRVHRCLHPEVEGGNIHSIKRLLFDRTHLEAENLRHVERLVTQCRPDIAMIWGMWNIPRSVPALVEQLLGDRVAYYFCDYWPSLPSSYQLQWQHESRRYATRMIKRLVGKPFLYKLRGEPAIHLEFRHPICVSRAVREQLVQEGVPIQHAKVVYLGTQADEFARVGRQHMHRERQEGVLRLLYAGRLTATKGVHTAITAIGKIHSEGSASVTLDILGKGEPDYERKLKEMVCHLHLEDHVHFLDKVPHAKMPELIAGFDALVFPSEWEEPFARTVLEAMATGIPVIGTTTGGTPEVLIDGITGLSYPAGDAEALAKQIQRLCNDEPFRRQLAQAAQESVRQNFTLQQTVEQLESILQGIACSKRPN